MLILFINEVERHCYNLAMEFTYNTFKIDAQYQYVQRKIRSAVNSQSQATSE